MTRNKIIIKSSFVTVLFTLLFLIYPVLAGSPSGNDTFELTASPFTGGDNTGDGGTGLANDLNYYYVGQDFTATMQISVNSASGSNGGDLWIDYDNTYFTASNLTTGSFYSNWTGQSISGGRVKTSAYNNPGSYSSGSGIFGTVDFSLLKPTAANYGTGSAILLDINTGVIGATTESNISYDGADILDDEEDFQLHIWADTKKPYALSPLPVDTATAVAVEDNYTFDLRDSKNGEGDNTGVGTGVNISTPPGAITFDDGGGASDYTAYDSYACSGVWGTNLCATTINPPSPLGISGDTRNWKYDTTYTVNISGFQDLASASQNQLGDANGPNTMDAKSWTFTTEADTVSPRVTSETPVRGSTGVAVDTNVIVEVTDRKTYPGGPSGTGVDSATCDISISSASFPSTTFTEGDAEVTVTAIDYGYRYTIDPASDFAQNEVVSVSVFNCQDLASVPNIMTTDNYTFTTADTEAPYVDSFAPSDNAIINNDGTISFHVKDDGVGVSLSDTVIYIDGNYYTDGGGAGTVTTSGTRITFATSLDFNGSNYIGDTTSVTGTSADYVFLLDPETDFPAGEVIPIIVYTEDNVGNIMERSVTGVATDGSSCPAGSTYCGANTSWDGANCIGTSSGSGGCSGGSGGSGGGSIIPKIHSQSIVQIDEQSVLLSWHSNLKGDARVVYDIKSPLEYGEAPMYNYNYAVNELDEDTVYHSVVVDNLESGKVYFFRPVTKTNRGYARGEEMKMAPMFKEKEIKPQKCETEIKTEKEYINVCELDEDLQEEKIAELKKEHIPVEVLNLEIKDGVAYVSGRAEPNSVIKIIIDPNHE